jgi:hypothetical protein
MSGRQILGEDKDGGLDRTFPRGRDVRCKSGRL